MLKSIRDFIINWGHFGFLGLGITYSISGEMNMAYMMLMLFVIEEVSSPRYDRKEK
jgi:hypothetical protein